MKFNMSVYYVGKEEYEIEADSYEEAKELAEMKFEREHSQEDEFTEAKLEE